MLNKRKLGILALAIVLLGTGTTVVAQIFISMQSQIGFTLASNQLMWSATYDRGSSLDIPCDGFAAANTVITGDSVSINLKYYGGVAISATRFVALKAKTVTAAIPLTWAGTNIGAGVITSAKLIVEFGFEQVKHDVLVWGANGVCTVQDTSWMSAFGNNLDTQYLLLTFEITFVSTSVPMAFSITAPSA